ncbi:type II toxin-antitoxin system CcdA family antitoxin [Cronobacter dublinensis]|uniref:type II toxin-antitoxin system CcdA family antitoxin n=1 Tax=Cronobacter dublinensis TaxID=413497 RepID=UPI003AB96E98
MRSPVFITRANHEGDMNVVVKPPKRTVSVTIDEALYQRARAQGINLSQRLSLVLEEDLRAIERQQWKDENREGLLELNRITDECGHFADEHRKF